MTSGVTETKRRPHSVFEGTSRETKEKVGKVSKKVTVDVTEKFGSKRRILDSPLRLTVLLIRRTVDTGQ